MVPRMTLRNSYRPVQFRVFLAVVALISASAVVGCTAPGSGGHTVGTTPASTVKRSEDIIRQVFGPELMPEAIEIAICESDLNPKAVSKTNDHGLFQINIINRAQWTEVTGQPWDAVYDPVWNTRFTKAMWDIHGWQPWVCKYVLGL
jgi:hypothetical protein